MVLPTKRILLWEHVGLDRGFVSIEGSLVRSLRHFHASVALQTGQNIVVVSKRLGHSNVSITSDIYAHALPGWQKQAAEAFAKATKGGERVGYAFDR